MKTGRTIQELAAEIARQSEAKKDYLAETTALQVAPRESGGVEVRGLNGDVYGINDHAHAQIAAELDIPKRYYDRMKVEAPALLADNANHWLHAEPKRRMVRTLDGNVRGWLSDRYRPLDNIQLAEAMLPVLAGMELQVLSCEITERRLYLKAVDRRIEKDIPTGRRLGAGHDAVDTVSPAIVISNSEVGAGALSVETAVWTRLCTNLAVFAQRSVRRYHLGARQELGEEIVALLSDDTRRKTDAALWAQTRDVIGAAFDRARFDALTEEIAVTSTRKITGDPVKVLELAGERFTMSDSTRGSVLRHLIEGGDLTQYGLFNAVTRTAEDQKDYDAATDLEKLGGKIVTLPRSDWEVLSAAA